MLFATLLFSGCSNKKEMLTEKEFVEEYLIVLKNNNPDVIYSLSDDLGIVAKYHGVDYRHFPDNAYREYTLEPGSINQILNKFSQTAQELYQKSEEIKVNNIIPLIKPINFLNEINQLGEAFDSTKHTVVHKFYNDDLLIVFAEDKGRTFYYFTQEDFHKLNIGQDSLLEIALHNLDKKLPDIERTGDDGKYMVTAGGDYEASLILLNSLWSRKNFAVKGDIVIAIPNHDILFISGSKDKEGIGWLNTRTQELYDSGSYQISPNLFRWDGHKFLRFK